MYQIKWSNGQVQTIDTLEDAAKVFGPEAVYCDNGESSDSPSEREIENAGRILVWASEEDAGGPDGMGDAGQSAIAQIVQV